MVLSLPFSFICQSLKGMHSAHQFKMAASTNNTKTSFHFFPKDRIMAIINRTTRIQGNNKGNIAFLI